MGGIAQEVPPPVLAEGKPIGRIYSMPWGKEGRNYPFLVAAPVEAAHGTSYLGPAIYLSIRTNREQTLVPAL